MSAKTKLLRIPRAFYDDHEARFLPSPIALKTSARFVWIDPSDRGLSDLISDAKYYADNSDGGWDPDVARTICRDAQRLLAAIAKARGG